jgi:hypothetical protein
MGTDFLRNKRERHSKAWRQGIAHTEGDWIAESARVTRVFRAKGVGAAGLAANQPVLLRLVANNKVVASSGVHTVATVDKPSLALVAQLAKSQGVCTAKIQRVSKSNQHLDLLVEE